MENNKNLYVLIFQIAVQYSSELEKLWFTGFSGNLSKWEYGNGNKNTKKNKELHIVFYKYYERFKDAIIDFSIVSLESNGRLTINPKRIAATHYISISLDNYYGYLYDVGSALNSLLEERIELNTI
jgi:hypothetical protein